MPSNNAVPVSDGTPDSGTQHTVVLNGAIPPFPQAFRVRLEQDNAAKATAKGSGTRKKFQRVPLAGIEPATCALEVRCSIQLSYRGGVFFFVGIPARYTRHPIKGKLKALQ